MNNKPVILMNNYCLTLHKMKVNNKETYDKFVGFKNLLNNTECNKITNNKKNFLVEGFNDC